MSKKMRHSKFKNTGILFELLTRQITADIISGKNNSEAQNLLFKFFKENTELGKEWKLYSLLLTEKIKDDIHAERYLSIILEQRKKLNDKQLTREKYELIKEIKGIYSIDNLLKSNIKNYRTLASIYKIFEDSVSIENKFRVDEIYQSKTCIVEHITDKPKKSSGEEELIKFYEQQSEDIRLLSYKILVEGMNKKYSVLDDSQKEIIREYINNISNTNCLTEFITKKLSDIRSEITAILPTIKDDVIKIKINEVIKQISSIKPTKIVKDNHIMVALLGYELLKEIKKVRDEKISS